MTWAPFFIVGYERSGTTLLAAAFDRHSRIAVPPETHFFTDLCPPARAQETGEPARMIDHLFRGARIRDLDLDRAQLLATFAESAPTWANLFQAALQVYARSRGKERAGEKTPNHWRATPDLLTLYPGARIIWVVRDGRDTVLSLMKTSWKAHANIGLHAVQWNAAMKRMLWYEGKFPGRILRIRFEELVTRSSDEMERACGFIGVSYEPGQLDPAAATGVVPDWERRWKGGVFRPLDSSRIGVAQREISAPMLRILDDAMESGMRGLGYLQSDERSPALSPEPEQSGTMQRAS